MITYPLVLQTISTLVGMTGVGCAIYATFFLKRVHGAVDEVKQSVNNQTEHLKQSIEKQTSELKP